MAERIARLEAIRAANRPKPNDPRDMLSDELSVRLMELARKVLLDPEADPEREQWAQETVKGVEAGIRARSMQAMTERYERHLAYCARVWEGRGGDAYVPALLGDEYDDWDKPSVMRRRLALRIRPDVLSIMEGAPA